MPAAAGAQTLHQTDAPRKDFVGEAPASSRREPPARAAAIPKGMGEKLQEEREPLQKLLIEDGVHLGLLTKDRAAKAARSAVGRTREDAEEIYVVKPRNNLHQQVRSYIRTHKGGPWPKPKDQEVLRLDIIATRPVNSVPMLARQILRERSKWESERNGGVMRNLLGGKLRLGFMRPAKL